MAVFARIILRYLAGFLVYKGLFSPDMGDTFAADPDIMAWTQLALAAALAAVSEGWYWLARKFGWAT
jgi:hypothetical protein